MAQHGLPLPAVGARAERDLSEAADVLASLGGVAKHDEDGEGDAALPSAPKRLRSSIARVTDVKRPGTAPQILQPDLAGSLGPGRLVEALDRLSGPASSSKHLADGREGLLQPVCQERILWFLTNSNEETVRPQPLRLDLLTEAGIQIAQAVLAWVGERFPSSKWLHEQPDTGVLEMFHATLQREYETQVSAAQPAGDQQQQEAMILLHHQAYASTYEAAKRQLPAPMLPLQKSGPDQEVNQPLQPTPSTEPDPQQETQPERSQTQDNAFPAQHLSVEERLAQLEAADQQHRGQAAQNQAHISQLHALFPRLVERLVTAENRLERAQSRLTALEPQLAHVPSSHVTAQQQQDIPHEPEHHQQHPSLPDHAQHPAEQQQQQLPHHLAEHHSQPQQHSHDPQHHASSQPQQQQQHHPELHPVSSHAELDLTSQGVSGMARPASASTLSPSLFLQSLPPGFGSTPVLPQHSTPALPPALPGQHPEEGLARQVELGELQGLRSLLLEPHAASMLGSSHDAVSALSTLQPTGDSNSASAARAAIAVLASQQSAHSLPEQMRQKLVELVDDRLHHLQGPPESAALGASFVAGLQQSAKPDIPHHQHQHHHHHQQQQQQQQMGFPAFQALPPGTAGQPPPPGSSMQPWHLTQMASQGGELAGALQSVPLTMTSSEHMISPAGGLAVNLSAPMSLPTSSNATARYYPSMANQPLEGVMALQQRPMGEDPGAPSSEIRERGKPWGFPQLSALGSLAEFWLLWNEGSPQTPVEDRKPVKEVRPEGQKGKRQRLLEWRHAAEYIGKRAEAKRITPEEMVRELEQERGHRKIAGYVRALGERLRYLTNEPGPNMMQLATS